MSDGSDITGDSAIAPLISPKLIPISLQPWEECRSREFMSCLCVTAVGEAWGLYKPRGRYMDLVEPA